jgi:hypothetical protein
LAILAIEKTNAYNVLEPWRTSSLSFTGDISSKSEIKNLKKKINAVILEVFKSQN